MVIAIDGLVYYRSEAKIHCDTENTLEYHKMSRKIDTDKRNVSYEIYTTEIFIHVYINLF